jgi:molybdopterin-guanine dinucleotide biosynthesis protein A
VVAGDMPYAGPALVTLVAALRTASPDLGAVVAVDAQGVPNPLLTAYRTASLREALPVPAADRPARLLLALPHLDLLVTGPASRGVDSQADLDDLAGPG